MELKREKMPLEPPMELLIRCDGSIQQQIVAHVHNATLITKSEVATDLCCLSELC